MNALSKNTSHADPAGSAPDALSIDVLSTSDISALFCGANAIA